MAVKHKIFGHRACFALLLFWLSLSPMSGLGCTITLPENRIINLDRTLGECRRQDEKNKFPLYLVPGVSMDLVLGNSVSLGFVPGGDMAAHWPEAHGVFIQREWGSGFEKNHLGYYSGVMTLNAVFTLFELKAYQDYPKLRLQAQQQKYGFEARITIMGMNARLYHVAVDQQSALINGLALGFSF